jgi:hypothetical protein
MGRGYTQEAQDRRFMALAPILAEREIVYINQQTGSAVTDWHRERALDYIFWDHWNQRNFRPCSKTRTCVSSSLKYV